MGASISGDAINQMVKLRAQQAGIKGRRITANSMCLDPRWSWRAYEKLRRPRQRRPQGRARTYERRGRSRGLGELSTQ